MYHPKIVLSKIKPVRGLQDPANIELVYERVWYFFSLKLCLYHKSSLEVTKV